MDLTLSCQNAFYLVDNNVFDHVYQVIIFTGYILYIFDFAKQQ